MDDLKFPELSETSDLALLKARKEIIELKAKLQQYEDILKENDLLDEAPKTVSDVELICTSQLSKYQQATASGSVLTLEEIKIVDLLTKNLLLAQGKAVAPEAKKTKKEEKTDIATLLQIASKRE